MIKTEKQKFGKHFYYYYEAYGGKTRAYDDAEALRKKGYRVRVESNPSYNGPFPYTLWIRKPKDGKK